MDPGRKLEHINIRSQSLNQADALEKLRGSIREALQPPKLKFTAEQEESIRKGKIKASR